MKYTYTNIFGNVDPVASKATITIDHNTSLASHPGGLAAQGML